jgi:alkyldihydroxyacetonephosphate synthase
MNKLSQNMLLEVLNDFRNIVSLDESDRTKHGKDAWPILMKTELESTNVPMAVVRPNTVDELSALMKVANSKKLSVIPYGGGSGVVGGVVPDRPTISIDLKNLEGIIDFDQTNLMIRTFSGTSALKVEKYLNEKGYTLGHYPQSLPLATVGGLVATRSSGTFSSKYGNIEDLLVSLEIVLPDGQVISNKEIPRSSTGPRLLDLFVGSEGTLGIITKVTLKIFPLPEKRCFRGVAFDSLGQAVKSVRSLYEKGLNPAVIRLYDVAEAEHHFEKANLPDCRNLLILGFDGPERVVDVEELLTLEVCKSYGGNDLGREIGENWERDRFDASWLEKGNESDLKVADAIEISGNWSDLLAIYTNVTRKLTGLTDKTWGHFSHFYPQGGSIYFIVFASGETKEEAINKYYKIWEETMKEVLANNGSISHHHGVGKIRSPWLREELGTSFHLLKTIKQSIDKHNILNPGKLGLPSYNEGEEDHYEKA